MAKEKVFPEGVRAFAPRNGAPEFVKGSIIITPNDLVAWLKKNPDLLNEHEGKKQISLDLLEGKKGYYLSVNTFKSNSKKAEAADDLPF